LGLFSRKIYYFPSLKLGQGCNQIKKFKAQKKKIHYKAADQIQNYFYLSFVAWQYLETQTKTAGTNPRQMSPDLENLQMKSTSQMMGQKLERKSLASKTCEEN